MSPYKQRGRVVWHVKVPTRAGWINRSTGTEDRATARAIEGMLMELGPRRRQAWDLLDAVASGRLKLPRLFHAYSMNALEQLRAQLSDVDLRPLVAEWERWAAGSMTAENIAKHKAVILTLAPEKEWWRSTFTRAACSAWLGSGTGSPGTKRRHAAAIASFATFLIERGVLEHSPMEGVKRPKANAPRVAFLEMPDVLRVVQASSGTARHLFAFMYGTGIELAAALRTLRRDVQLQDSEVYARGTKTAWRQRMCVVAEWARPYLAEACDSLLLDAPLFPGLSRWDASDLHRGTLESLGLRTKPEKGKPPVRDGCTLHDARHHWAVRAIRAGWPIELVARQLGHVDGTLALRVYGRYVPTGDERRRWEAVASAEDARRGLAGGLAATAPKKAKGGTRG